MHVKWDLDLGANMVVRNKETNNGINILFVYRELWTNCWFEFVKFILGNDLFLFISQSDLIVLEFTLYF